MSHQKNKWVIVFLIYADFRTDDEFSMNELIKTGLNSLFRDILTCPIDPEAMRLYVVLDSIRYTFTDKDGKFMIDERAVFYEIKESKGRKHNEFGTCMPVGDGLREINTPGHVNILQDAERLAGVLKKHVPVHEDEKSFLITWDHGAAFGIFRETSPHIQNPISKKPIDNHLDKYPYIGLFWDMAYRNDKFRCFIDSKNNEQPRDFVIREGHNIYKISGRDERSALLKKIIPTQQSLDLFRVNKIDKCKLIINCKSVQVLPMEKANTDFSDEQRAAINDFYESQGTYEIDFGEPHAPEILENQELAYTIEIWLGKKGKVSVLLMMNCFMMNLHTMYSLKDQVKYLVAPMGGIDNPGYNYKDLLLYLFNQPEGPVSPDKLAIKAVDTSHNRYMRKMARRAHEEDPNLKDKDTIEYRAILAVKLDYMSPASHDQSSSLDQFIKKLKSVFDNLNKLLEPNPNDPNDPSHNRMQVFKTLRLLSFDFTGRKYYLIDILNWLEAAYGLYPFIKEFVLFSDKFAIEIDSLYTDFADSPMILRKFFGECLFAKDYTILHDNLSGRLPSGFSIFFPFQSINDDVRQDNIASDKLLSREFTNWNDFLKKMYRDIKY